MTIITFYNEGNGFIALNLFKVMIIVSYILFYYYIFTKSAVYNFIYTPIKQTD